MFTTMERNHESPYTVFFLQGNFERCNTWWHRHISVNPAQVGNELSHQVYTNHLKITGATVKTSAPSFLRRVNFFILQDLFLPVKYYLIFVDSKTIFYIIYFKYDTFTHFWNKLDAFQQRLHLRCHLLFFLVRQNCQYKVLKNYILYLQIIYKCDRCLHT